MSLKRCPNGHLFSEKRHGVICPYCNISTSNLSSVPGEDPQGIYSDRNLLDMEPLKPVTGWLVCLKGSSEGKDYRIVPEKNFIGRSSGMDIRIINDNEIDQSNHAVIVFDPEQNKTVLLPGTSNGLVYIYNDEDKWEAVHAEREIFSGDKLKMGQSEFIFVALCNKEDKRFYFDWKDK